MWDSRPINYWRTVWSDGIWKTHEKLTAIGHWTCQPLSVLPDSLGHNNLQVGMESTQRVYQATGHRLAPYRHISQRGLGTRGGSRRSFLHCRSTRIVLLPQLNSSLCNGNYGIYSGRRDTRWRNVKSIMSRSSLTRSRHTNVLFSNTTRS